MAGLAGAGGLGKIINSKIIFGTTDGQDLHGWAEKRRAALGQAKLALCFQIPSQASLHGIVKNPSLILLRK